MLAGDIQGRGEFSRRNSSIAVAWQAVAGGLDDCAVIDLVGQTTGMLQYKAGNRCGIDRCAGE